MAEKKHKKIRKEIERMHKADDDFCYNNSQELTDFQRGKIMVYQDLLKFIDKL